MRNGAVTILDRPYNDEHLWDAIREGLARDANNRRRRATTEKLREDLALLTSSERKVLEMLVEGLPNKTIASALDVSLRTVESRRQKICQTLKTQSLAHVVRMYVEAELAGILQ